MATRLPAKSILKQTPPTTKPTLSDEEKAKAERDRRNLGIALYHANKIQHQKDVQAQTLFNIETLLDCPANTTPTPDEASKFIALVHPFQPSDFDSLVEERHIDGRCGYALCSNAPRSKTLGSNAAWKLKAKGAEDYCSNECLRKALYVKSQLSEVPAWEREPGQQPQIVLEGGEAPFAAEGGASLYEELALERGDTAASFRPGQVMTPNVIEKAIVAPKVAANERSAATSHTAIEGYEPTMTFKDEAGSKDLELSTAEDLIAGDKSFAAGAPADENEEREAWRDLFENIGKR